jgi:hypothetical protein
MVNAFAAAPSRIDMCTGAIHPIVGAGFPFSIVGHEIHMASRRSSHQQIVKAAAFRSSRHACAHRATHEVNAQEVQKKTEVKKKTVATLEGSWSGGGSVSFASGSREQAHCRAHYRRAGNNSYSVNATCATASGRAAQTATVRQVGGRTDTRAASTTASIRFRA